MKCNSTARIKPLYYKACRLNSCFKWDKKHTLGRLVLVLRTVIFCLFFFHASAGIAANTSDITLGTMATTITQSFGDVTKLITAASYIAGLGFSFSAMLKFKQHINNPTQNTIGAALAILFIGASFIYFPSFLSMTGQTMFGGYQVTAGPFGFVFSSWN